MIIRVRYDDGQPSYFIDYQLIDIEFNGTAILVEKFHEIVREFAKREKWVET